MFDEVGMALNNLCRAVSGGVVVFFPSYAYEQAVVETWTESGRLGDIEVCPSFQVSVFVLTAYRNSNESSEK